MGQFIELKCSNTACQYHVKYCKGPGRIGFAQAKTLERDIMAGKKDAPDEIKELLSSGHKLDCVRTFLCSSCREWQVIKDPFIIEKVQSPLSNTTKDGKMHFLNGKPKCEKCGTELVLVTDPISSKKQCPKCGKGNMTVTDCGCYD